MAEAKTDIVLSNVFNKKLKNSVDATFIKKTSKDDSAFVTGYDKIIIPQFSGAIPQFDITSGTDWNSQTFATVTHTSNEYAIATRGFGSVLVTVLDQEELLYNKANAIMDEMMGDIDTFLAEKVTYGWTTEKTDNMVRTKGTATRGNVYGNSSIKRMLYSDFLEANLKLDEQKISREGRICVLNARLYSDVKLWDEWDNAPVIMSDILAKGTVGTVDGVTFILRETDNVFDGLTTVPELQAFGSATAATDLGYALVYHPNYVRHAIGTDTTNGGGKFIVRYPAKVAGAVAFEAYVRVGASRSYLDGSTDSTGIVTIIEAK